MNAALSSILASSTWCLLFLLSAFVPPSSLAADSLTPAQRAAQAAPKLPRGAIVTATQTADASPVITVAGKPEPANVSPDKIIFEIGSISKVFTGLLLAQAVIEKKVTLDTTLRELMGPRQAFADPNVSAITLKQLAIHTSGLPRLPDNLDSSLDPKDPYASYDRARLDAFIAKAKLPHAPPFAESYSNLGAGLLGDLLARLYRSDWGTLVVDRIAKPLGMADTCVVLNAEQQRRLAPPYAGPLPVKRWRFQALAGAGALHSTAADMLRFGRALDRPETTPLSDAIAMIEQPHSGPHRGLSLMRSLGKGKTEFWSQGGTGGYRSWISVNPATHEVLVMLINNSILDAEEILFRDDADEPAVAADPALTPYAGVYDTGVKAGGVDIHYAFEVRGSALWMQITGQSFIPLTAHPSKKDCFEFKPVKAEIQFTRRKDDVVSTTLFQDGLEIHARRIPTSPK